VSYVVRCTNEMLSSDVSSFSGFSSFSGLWLHDWPGVFRPGLVTLPHGVGPASKTMLYIVDTGGNITHNSYTIGSRLSGCTDWVCPSMSNYMYLLSMNVCTWGPKYQDHRMGTMIIGNEIYLESRVHA
jgi:hypothetical protein